jgi:hypothetical protein
MPKEGAPYARWIRRAEERPHPNAARLFIAAFPQTSTRSCSTPMRWMLPVVEGVAERADPTRSRLPTPS